MDDWWAVRLVISKGRMTSKVNNVQLESGLLTDSHDSFLATKHCNPEYRTCVSVPVNFHSFCTVCRQHRYKPCTSSCYALSRFTRTYLLHISQIGLTLSVPSHSYQIHWIPQPHTHHLTPFLLPYPPTPSSQLHSLFHNFVPLSIFSILLQKRHLKTGQKFNGQKKNNENYKFSATENGEI